MRVARGERKFIRLGRDDARAAVRPAQFARRFQDRQIAAHGRDRGYDVLGEFFQRREFHALKIGFNAVFAFVGGHGSKNLFAAKRRKEFFLQDFYLLICGNS